MPRQLSLFVFILCAQFARSQHFELHNPFTEFFLIRENEFGTGLSSFDVDEDGWDDYTVCSWNTPTRYFRNVNGELILTKLFPNNKDATACVWSDLDNDGKNDLIVIRRNAKPQLWWQEENFDFTLDTISLHSEFLPTNSPFSTSVGDYNRDGKLDVIITNYSYNFGNRIFTNLGNRLFQLAPFGNINYNGVLSFQASWIDLNYDLYPELYIVNDHAADCEMYQYLNEYTMLNITTEVNLKNTSDAMSNSWTDFDNDGDFDVFTSNGTNQTNFLCINSDGVFTNIGPSQGLIYPLESWGGLWIDIENNGWQDLLICTNEGIGTGNLNNKFYLNEQGNLNETYVADLHDNTIGYHSAVRADIDNNGTSDIFISPEYYFPNAALNLNQKKAFLCVPNSNNYIKFRLKGRWSNRNGIGTRYSVYANDLHYSGFTQCGEGYLSQNTQNIICGLGTHLSVDSLLVYWPSGIIDKYFNMQINSSYLLEEGETINLFKISPNSCLDSLNSIGSVQLPQLIWPDQSTANPYETSENNLTVLTNTGFGNSVSLTIQIPEYVPPQLSTSFESPACLGQDNGSISSFLIRSDIDTLSSIQWNALPPGTYTLEHVFDDGCLMQDSINLEYANSISLTNLHLTPNCWNDSSSTLQALIEGGTPPYNNQFYNDTIYYSNIPSGPFHLVVADAINCSVDTTVVIPFVPVPIITLSVDSTFSPIYEFHAESSNSESTFMWNNNFSGSIFTADISSGLALELTVTDNNGCVSDTLLYFQPPTNMYTLENGKFIACKEGVKWLSDQSINDVVIYDLTGKCLREINVLNGNTLIPLPPQAYIVHVRNKSAVKIIVE